MLDIRIILGESVTGRFRDGKPVPYNICRYNGKAQFVGGGALDAPVILFYNVTLSPLWGTSL